MDSFEKDVSRLETINKKLETTKISIDLKEYKSIIESHQQKMTEMINTQERFSNRFENLLKNAKIYPNWVVIVFLISILISTSVMLYSFYSKMTFQ